MKEIGGFIELDTYKGKMLYEDGIKLNCGRNALAYIIKAKNIKKIYMPKFMCNSCDDVLAENGIEVCFYNVGMDFKPKITEWDGWLYVVNFYGQLSNNYLSSLGDRIIVDNAQAYFQPPIPNVDTLYTCRKFFGVADGSILYTNKQLDTYLSQDVSYDRMRFLLGRYEQCASNFYSEYVMNNELFKKEPIKQMSKLTYNLLHGIDYGFVKENRTNNFMYLHDNLKKYNRLNLCVPEGAFMYPLYVSNGEEIRSELLKQKIYIPVLWPSVFKTCNPNELEYDLAKNILPLPIDQRYGTEHMNYIISEIKKYL